MRDVLRLPVALLRGMPLATTLALVLRSPPGTPDVRAVFTTSQSSYAAALRIGAAPFAPDEYEAVALAVELERAAAGDVVVWCRAKIEQPCTITARVAMAGAEGLVPHIERFGEERVRGPGGRSHWQSVKVGTAPRDVDGDGRPVQQRTTLTFGELLERIGAEYIGCTVHERPVSPRAREATAGEPTETFAEI